MDTTTLILILAVVLGLAVGTFLFFRGRASKEEPYYHFRCTNCRRRLRYQERQVGHKGQCSNCGKSVVFPSIAQSID